MARFKIRQVLQVLVVVGFPWIVCAQIQPSPLFIRGDANSDGDVNGIDFQAILTYLTGVPDHGVKHFDAADVNDDGFLTLEDAIWLGHWLYIGPPQPMPPFPKPGLDPTRDTITETTVEPPPEPDLDTRYKVWLYRVTSPHLYMKPVKFQALLIAPPISVIQDSPSQVHAAVKFNPKHLRFIDARLLPDQIEPWRLTVVEFFNANDPAIIPRGEVGLTFYHDKCIEGSHPAPTNVGLVELTFSRIPATPEPVERPEVQLVYTVGTRNLYYYSGVGLWSPLPKSPADPTSEIIYAPEFKVSLRETGSRFIRGDTNADGDFNLADLIFILSFIFTGGNQPTCMDTADINDSGSVDISDPIYGLSYLFLGGPKPPPPFGEIPEACGVDPTHDELSCDVYEPCYLPIDDTPGLHP